MEQDCVDFELYDLLLRFVQLSRRLTDKDGPDLCELFLERMDLATQLRQRGFMISEQPPPSRDGSFVH